jgi:hypothetical protein
LRTGKQSIKTKKKALALEEYVEGRGKTASAKDVTEKEEGNTTKK